MSLKVPLKDGSIHVYVCIRTVACYSILATNHRLVLIYIALSFGDTSFLKPANSFVWTVEAWLFICRSSM